MRRPLMLVCMAFVATIYLFLTINPQPSTSLEDEGCVVTLSGVVYQKEYKNQILQVYLETNSQNPTKLLCKISNGDEPKMGSTIQVRGTVKSFMQATNPGGFDQIRYYEILGVSGQLDDADIVDSSEEFSKYKEALYQLRRKLEYVFDVTLSEKESGIMKAMLLGNKTELDSDSKELYQKSGIAHVLAISGLHISILGMGLYSLLAKLRCPKSIGAVLSVVLMICYGDMVGMSSSAFRAIFMFAMRMGGKLMGRTYDMLTALAISAVLILLEQPLYLYHSGFLLSFGAIIGIGFMGDVFKIDGFDSDYKWLSQVSRSIGSSIGGSLSIFSVHFPIILCTYYEFPVYSFLLNLIIIPLMSVLMVIGLICLGLGALYILTCTHFGATPMPLWIVIELCSYMVHLLLAGFEAACNLTLDLPLSRWIVGRPDTYRVVLFCFVIVALYGLHQYGKKNDIAGPGGFTKLIFMLGAVMFITSHTYGELKITMVDVGQGDGIWIESPDGNHYLIDGGSTSKKQLAKYTLLPYLKYTNTDRIDMIFLTHLDSDHISGVIELINPENGDSQIEVGGITISEAAIEDDALIELQVLCKENGIPLKYASTGDSLRDGDMYLQVYHPDSDYVTDNRNAYSLVMGLDYQGFHALFTGDVEADGEKIVSELWPEDNTCHLYKAAHHGSNSSNTELLLETISPQLTIISCGLDNSYGHPHKETLERLEAVGSKVIRTDESGAIMLRVRDGKITVDTYLE